MAYALTGTTTVPRATPDGQVRDLALLDGRPIAAETSSRQVYVIDVEPVAPLMQIGEEGDAIVRLVTGRAGEFVAILRREDTLLARVYGADGQVLAERALAPEHPDLTRFRDGYRMVDSTGITHLDGRLMPLADPPWAIDPAIFRAEPSSILWLDTWMR